MKGIPIIRLKRLQRTAVLLGAGALAAGASVLGATSAHAALGNQPGAVALTPSSGAATTTGITYATTTACPAGFQGSGLLRIIDPNNQVLSGGSTNLSVVNNSVAAPFNGVMNTTFAVAEQIFPDIVGNTSEVAILCFAGASAQGAVQVVQSTFVTISADGSTYTETNAGPPTATTTTLAASPTTASAGQSVTLTATVAPSSATGSVQFSVGGTAIGGPATVTGGVATTTTSFAAAGTEALSAVYTPTGNFTGSTSNTLNYVVTAAAPNSGVIPLAVTVPATGTFTLTVDTTDTVTLAVSGSNGTAATTPIVVSDTRNTFPGWSVSGQDGNWTGSGTAAGATISGNQLGWTPTSSTSPLTQGVTLGGVVAPAAPGLGSTAAVLASVHAGINNGFGTTTLGANLNLLIPNPQAAGPYTSGLDITSVSTNP
jgi:hypothetical protein